MLIPIIMLCLAIPCIVCSVFGFMKKGPIITTEFIVSNKRQRERMKNKKNYLFSGIVYGLLGISFLLTGLSAYLKNSVLMYVAESLCVITVIVVIAFSIHSECQ